MKVKGCRPAPSAWCPKNHDLAINQIRKVVNIFTIGHLGVCAQDARMSVLLLRDLSAESATQPERRPVFTHRLCLMNCKVAAAPSELDNAAYCTVKRLVLGAALCRSHLVLITKVHSPLEARKHVVYNPVPPVPINSGLQAITHEQKKN